MRITDESMFWCESRRQIMSLAEVREWRPVYAEDLLEAAPELQQTVTLVDHAVQFTRLHD